MAVKVWHRDLLLWGCHLARLQ